MTTEVELIEILKKAILPKPQLPIITGKIKAVAGDSCTVVVDGQDLTDVRLKATITGSEDKLLLTPKVGSLVLIGSLTGDLKDLCVLKIDELEKLEYKQDGLGIEIDSKTGKVSVKNSQVSLRDLFQTLKDLILQLKVTTPSGPSTNLLPDSIAALQQFEMKFNQLLN